VRKLGNKPVLLSETAVGPFGDQAALIPGLFAGVQQGNLLGLVWFDVAQHQGEFHLDWRLEGQGRGAAQAAFRQAAETVINGTAGPSPAPSPTMASPSTTTPTHSPGAKPSMGKSGG
jgi:hypothetical protein